RNVVIHGFILRAERCELIGLGGLFAFGLVQAFNHERSICARDDHDAVAARADVVAGMDDRTTATDRHVDFARSEFWPRPDRYAARVDRKAAGLGLARVTVSAVHHQAFEAALLDSALQHLEAAKAPVAEPLRIDHEDIPGPHMDQGL